MEQICANFLVWPIGTLKKSLALARSSLCASDKLSIIAHSLLFATVFQCKNGKWKKKNFFFFTILGQSQQYLNNKRLH